MKAIKVIRTGQIVRMPDDQARVMVRSGAGRYVPKWKLKQFEREQNDDHDH